MEAYNEGYYRNYDVGLQNPVDYKTSEYTKNFLEGVAKKIVELYHPKVVLDAGCAMGHLVAALRDLGVEAYGIDISEYAISQVRDDIRPYCAVGSLTEPLPESMPKHFDLITNIEVIEHLYAEDAQVAIANMCSLTDTIVFSSSPDDFAEPTHVNVQQREYWAKIFAQNGFLDCIMSRPTFLTEYAICFQRTENWIRQVEDYERNIRQEAKLTKERNELITSQNLHVEKLNAEIQNQQDKYEKEISACKDSLDTKNRQVQELHIALEEKEEQIERLGETLEDQKRQVGNLEETLEEKKRHVESLEKIQNGQRQQMENLKKEVEEKEQKTVELREHCEFTLGRYYEVINSTSWKITKPIRTVLDHLKRVLKAHRKTATLYKGCVCLVKCGPKQFFKKTKAYLKRKKEERKDEKERELFVPLSKDGLNGPKISILVPLYHTPEKYLREMLESVLNQTYSNWELCLCDASGEDLSVQRICTEYTSSEPRILYIHLDSNLGISENTNACAKLAKGEYIALLDHDDFLMPDALRENVRVINSQHPDVLYSDEDHYTADHVHVNPFFKPNWSPNLLYSQMYIGHLLVFRRELFNAVGGFRKEFDGSQDYDLMLRMSEYTDKIYHIPLILYSWRESENSTAANAAAKPYAHDAGKKALDAHLKRVYGEQAFAADGPYTFVYDARFPLPIDVMVSIIIPMKDKWELSEACINSILEKSTYQNYEILILDNRSEEEDTLSWLTHIGEKDKRIRVLKADMEFNWSKINNFGAHNARGDVFVFLNNDTLVITKNWLERLCENALRADIGTVGALLKYEDETIQHAGVVVGIGGWADHVFKGMDAIHFGAPFVSPMVSRDVTAVTGACVAIAKDKFKALGGFDESFVICGSDVELGIRANKTGLYNRYDANVQLYHLESKSRSSFIPDIDFKRSYECYTPYRESCDPFFNPNLDINSTTPKENCGANTYKMREIMAQNAFNKKNLQLTDSVDVDTLPNPYRIPEIQPMNPRTGMERGKVRINLLIPSVDKKHVFGGIATAIKFFETMCERIDCEQRIVLMDAAYYRATSVADSKYELVPCNEDSAKPYQIVPFHDRCGKTIPVSKNDIFLATGWWTAYTVADIIRWQKRVYGGNFNPLVYLIQDYEPGFYPWSSRYMLADSTYRMEIPTFAIFNSNLLQRHFLLNNYEFDKSWCFDPVLNGKLAEFLPTEKEIQKKRKIVIYARPNTERNAFALIVMALRKWTELYADAMKWEIIAAGETFEPVAISKDITLKSVGKLTLEAYAKVMLEAYAGISLMVSPHPSYPPLEMATFGAKTITNCYANKDLKCFNENIVSLKSCSPLQIAQKLAEICSNYTGVGYPSIDTSYARGNDEFSTVAQEVGDSVIETMQKQRRMLGHLSSEVI